MTQTQHTYVPEYQTETVTVSAHETSTYGKYLTFASGALRVHVDTLSVEGDGDVWGYDRGNAVVNHYVDEETAEALREKFGDYLK